MRVPERLVEVWAAGADGRGKCGSGWAVGHAGVLCCRHVLERYVSSIEDNPDRPGVVQIRRAGASSSSAWIDCVIAWGHPTRDLVLLRVTPGADQTWDPPTERSPRLAATGQRPSDCVATGVPQAEVRPTRLRDSEQAPGRLLPAGGARDPQGLVPFDVDVSVPDDAVLWEGFSGSAVHDEHDRLVALVVKVHPDRQQRRLLVVLVEDTASDPAFVSAAAVVGLDPAVEDRQAPLWRQSVDPGALTAAGVPPRVADVTDLRVLGVRGAFPDTAGLYPDYLDRDRDADLDAALAQARGGGRRLVLVVGDSAAGKTRSVREALRRDRVLRGWRLVVPLSDGGLSRLAGAGLGWQETVLWLDDLDKHLGRGLDLSTVRRALGDAATVMVIATMRTSQLQARQSELADPAWELLTDDAQVIRVDLDAALSDRELATAHAQSFDPALLRALEQGVGLGEWLVAGPELMKKLNGATGLDRVLADTVIAWYRTGLNQPLAQEDARRLWADALPRAQRQRLFDRAPGDQHALFQKASAWACKPVIGRDLYEQALVARSADGYVPHDYVVDQVVRDPRRPAVADPVWQHAHQIATTSPEAQRATRVWEVGIASEEEHALAHAMTAMQALAETGDAGALFNVGVLLGQLGRSDEAIEVYDQLDARFADAPEPALQEHVAQARWLKKQIEGDQD
ncbi:MAG: trypsin-like peptidase domain-containing protein [Egibacteraceae bacterium]